MQAAVASARAIARPLRFPTLVALVIAAIGSLASCQLDPEQAARARAMLSAAQDRAAQLEGALAEADELRVDLERRIETAIDERDNARREIFRLETELAGAVASGDVDRARRLRGQINTLRPAADADGLDELRAAMSRLDGFIEGTRDEREAIADTVARLGPELVSQTGQIDWAGAVEAAVPVTSIIPGYGTAAAAILTGLVAWLRERQQRNRAENAAATVADGHRKTVRAIEAGRRKHREAWEQMRDDVEAEMPPEARQLVEWSKGRNSLPEIEDLIARTRTRRTP